MLQCSVAVGIVWRQQSCTLVMDGTQLQTVYNCAVGTWWTQHSCTFGHVGYAAVGSTVVLWVHGGHNRAVCLVNYSCCCRRRRRGCCCCC